MVLNPDKCHFLTPGFNKLFPDFSFENIIIKNVTDEKILEILIRAYSLIINKMNRSLYIFLLIGRDDKYFQINTVYSL